MHACPFGESDSLAPAVGKDQPQTDPTGRIFVVQLTCQNITDATGRKSTYYVCNVVRRQPGEREDGPVVYRMVQTDQNKIINVMDY
jgi:hypothetical protein